jgi:hypothetical protein
MVSVVELKLELADRFFTTERLENSRSEGTRISENSAHSVRFSSVASVVEFKLELVDGFFTTECSGI